MRRAVIILFLCSVPASAAVVEYSSEYRRDNLDAEDEVREFYREKVRFNPNGEVTAGLAFSDKTAIHERSCTWNAAVKGKEKPFVLMAGDFYAQEG